MKFSILNLFNQNFLLSVSLFKIQKETVHFSICYIFAKLMLGLPISQRKKA